jgi:hypothetical protein
MISTEPAPFPAKLAAWLQQDDKPTTNGSSSSDRIPQGERNTYLASLAGAARRKGATEAELRALLHAANERCDPPLDPRDINRTCKSIARYAPAEAPTNGTGIDHEASNDQPTGWEPIDAVAKANHPHPAPDVGPLFYSGLRHVLSGESEAGKSLLCLAIAAQEMLEGRSVLYIDYDGMGPTMSVDLLRCLAVPDHTTTKHFLYLTPETPFQTARDQVLALLDAHHIRLVVIDTLNPALGAHNLDSEKTSQTDIFYREVVDQLRSRGAAVVLLDHVPKNKDTRGRYSYGAEGKLTRCDVSLGLEARQPIGRGRTGIVTVKTHKDRPSRLPRPAAGTLTWISDPDTGRITWHLKHADPDAALKPFRPTHLMEKVSRYLEQHGESTTNQILEGVPHKRDDVRKALQRLVFEEFCQQREGGNRSLLTLSTRPYRELEDVDSDRYLPVGPGGSQVGPGPTDPGGTVGPPPLGDTREPPIQDTSPENWWDR